MTDYTDLFQDVSYYSLLICMFHFFEKCSGIISNVVVGFLFLKLEIYFFCFIVKSNLERLNLNLFYAKATS